jgi:hypothetical protein
MELERAHGLSMNRSHLLGSSASFGASIPCCGSSQHDHDQHTLDLQEED